MALSAEDRAAIQDRYPAFAYLLDNPEVAGLLDRAFTEGWSEARFVSSLYATNYYRSRSEAERQTEALRQLDPSEYAAQARAKFGSVQEFAGKMGIAFAPGEMEFITAGLTNSGTDINDPEARMSMLNWARAHPDRITSNGAIYAAAQRADQIARQEYFFAPSNYDVMQTGINIAMGAINEDAYKTSLGEWFANVTPHLADRLKAGETYAQIVNPFRDVVAKELELGGVEAVDMVGTNEWKWLMGMPDPTSGEVRLPTQQEVIAAARKDTRWKGTVGATSLATNLVDGITKAWGVR